MNNLRKIISEIPWGNYLVSVKDETNIVIKNIIYDNKVILKKLNIYLNGIESKEQLKSIITTKINEVIAAYDTINDNSFKQNLLNIDHVNKIEFNYLTNEYLRVTCKLKFNNKIRKHTWFFRNKSKFYLQDTLTKSIIESIKFHKKREKKLLFLRKCKKEITNFLSKKGFTDIRINNRNGNRFSITAKVTEDAY